MPLILAFTCFNFQGQQKVFICIASVYFTSLSVVSLQRKFQEGRVSNDLHIGKAQFPFMLIKSEK